MLRSVLFGSRSAEGTLFVGEDEAPKRWGPEERSRIAEGKPNETYPIHNHTNHKEVAS